LYKVKINEPGRIIPINGKQVRSPFECEMHESNLKVIESYIKFYGIVDFTIEKMEPIKEVKVEKVVQEVIKEKKRKKVISGIGRISIEPSNSIPVEELQSKKSSILSKILSE